MSNELEPGRCGALVAQETACLWCWFLNEQGTYTIAWCESEPDCDDFYTEGVVVEVVPDQETAKRLVYLHNIGVLAMLERMLPEDYHLTEPPNGFMFSHEDEDFGDEDQDNHDYYAREL